ncbi:MAG: biopolymer transporter ExbD [Gemmatimonadetes bacterium]|nr:biopolymer transporter ExbD [Gemmatimonadota bacterium]
MAAKKGAFQRKSGVRSEIPTASMADIAFLLLIFFMVATTFRKEQPRPVVIPEAEATQRTDEKRKNILHVYVETDGSIYINDRLVPSFQVADVVRPEYVKTDRRLVVSLKADRDAAYEYVNAVTEELRRANAVRVLFSTDLERRLARARR